jgi:GNAT superfamily N-acetyltransferase
MTDPGATIETVWMEMTAPPSGPPPAAPAHAAEVRREAPPTLAMYRALHAEIGAPWGWDQHVDLPDADLGAVLADPAVTILVLWIEGEAAGFAELDGRAGDGIEIVHFGLAPRWFGSGIGSWFLRQVLEIAWSARPTRVWLHTDTCDHPKARAVYAAAGFAEFRRTWEPGACPDAGA